MPFANLLTGVEIYYEIAGAGDPLLMIMGTTADHTSWDAQVEAYRDKYRVVTFDARGTGQSTHPAGIAAYSMSIFARSPESMLI